MNKNDNCWVFNIHTARVWFIKIDLGGGLFYKTFLILMCLYFALQVFILFLKYYMPEKILRF